jgi:hypothetical protein
MGASPDDGRFVSLSPTPNPRDRVASSIHSPGLEFRVPLRGRGMTCVINFAFPLKPARRASLPR